MTKGSDNLFPGIILNEAANDGSDFANPDADYRRLFLGEDGVLHVKDSTGAVTSPVAGGAGALVLLEQHTASSSASLDFTTAISGTYDEYVVEFINVLPATSTAIPCLRFNTGGGFDSGAHYGWAGWRWLSSGSGAVGANSGATQIQLTLGIATTANYPGLCGTLHLYNPAGGSAYPYVTGQFFTLDSAAAVPLGTVMGGLYLVTTAITQFQVIFSTGNIASGTIRVYGIVKT
jgi:hypothetical protein